MKYFTFFLVFLCLLCSCDNDDNTKDSEHFTFTNNALITIRQNDGFHYAVVDTPGDQLVFEYQFIAGEDPQIADDEYSESVIFEIPQDLTSFSYSDDELSQIKAYISRHCFCLPEGSYAIVNGAIEGRQINDREWSIVFDFSYIRREKQIHKQIQGIFILE